MSSRYGGIPDDALLLKLEETDPRLFNEHNDQFYDIKDNYNNYVRSEITDWNSDAPFLESDNTKRDPSLARSMINLRYNGTRGSSSRLPSNPDLFYGFTGNDPRGANNDPRLDKLREQMTVRGANLEIRMGNNDVTQIAEQPWSDLSLSYSRKEIQRRQKANSIIFNAQKEGKSLSNNTVTTDRDNRSSTLDTGDESLGSIDRFASSDYKAANENCSDGIRGVNINKDADSAPWRHTISDGTLGVQQYGQNRGAGRSKLSSNAQGGGKLKTNIVDQDWKESKNSSSTNRNSLAATMAVATRHHHAIRSGIHDSYKVSGSDYENIGIAGGNLKPSDDVAHIYRHSTQDQSHKKEYDNTVAGAGLKPSTDVNKINRRTTEDQSHKNEISNNIVGAGLKPNNRPVRKTEAHVTNNTHLTNLSAIVQGLKEGSASSKRRIAGAVSTMTDFDSNDINPNNKGMKPSEDFTQIKLLSDMQVINAAAAEDLVVHVYSSMPKQQENKAAMGTIAYDNNTWALSQEALQLGISKTPGEWLSHTQDNTVLGDTPDRIFGLDEVFKGAGDGAAMGSKNLRAGTWSNSAALEGFGGNDFGTN